MRSPGRFNMHTSRVPNFAIEISCSTKKPSCLSNLKCVLGCEGEKKTKPLLKPIKHLWKCQLNPHSQFSSWIQFVSFGWRDCSLSSDTRKCWGLTHDPQFQSKNMQKKKCHWCHLLGFLGFAWLAISVCLSPEQNPWLPEPWPLVPLQN